MKWDGYLIVSLCTRRIFYTGGKRYQNFKCVVNALSMSRCKCLDRHERVSTTEWFKPFSPQFFGQELSLLLRPASGLAGAIPPPSRDATLSFVLLVSVSHPVACTTGLVQGLFGDPFRVHSVYEPYITKHQAHYVTMVLKRGRLIR